MKIVLFYTPVSNTEEAHTLGREAVHQKLAACANSFPADSSYFWKGEMQKDNEVIILLKTTIERQGDLRRFIEENHSYDVPAVLSWEVEVNDAYGAWVKESTA